MASRKQRAASLRNLKKARAALKRSRKSTAAKRRKVRRRGRTKSPFNWGFPESAFAPGRRRL